MRLRDEPLALRINQALVAYETDFGPMAGIRASARRTALVEQLVESDRRNRYMRSLVSASLGESRRNPLSGKFDPLKAAALWNRDGRVDEAFWMIFLFVHFGKHRIAGWDYAAGVYGKLGHGGAWDWQSVSNDVMGFRDWMDANAPALRGASGPRGFGNHRKYESLSGWSTTGTGAAVASYVEWVGPTRVHADRFDQATGQADPFDVLYKSMTRVQRFGRVARFDYLSTLGKLDLVDLRPARAYIAGSTGPAQGARLLFEPSSGRESSPSVLDTRLIELEGYLDVGFDTLEDGLCNWQKSPDQFRPFRG